MTKIVYNACYGGFSLSEAACNLYDELKDQPRGTTTHGGRDIPRNDPALAEVVERLGAQAASGAFAALAIRELPIRTKYRIDGYDGYESVMTIDEYEWQIA